MKNLAHLVIMIARLLILRDYEKAADTGKKGLKPRPVWRSTFFPDFRIRIVPYKGEAYTFDVEVDAAGLGRSVVFAKISSFKNNILLVVPNGERLRRLFQYLQYDMAKRQATLPAVSFVLWSHFLANGCRFSEVIQFPSGGRGVLPISIK